MAVAPRAMSAVAAKISFSPIPSLEIFCGQWFVTTATTGCHGSKFVYENK